MKHILSMFFVLVITASCSTYQLKIPYAAGRADSNINVLLITFDDLTGNYKSLGYSIEDKIAEGLTIKFKGMDISLRSEGPRYRKVPSPYKVTVIEHDKVKDMSIDEIYQKYKSHIVIKGKIEQIEYTNSIQNNVYYGNALLDLMSLMNSGKPSGFYYGIIGLRYEIINAKYNATLKKDFTFGASDLVDPEKTNRNAALRLATKDIVEEIVCLFSETR